MIGNRLKALRTEKKLTQQGLADLIGTSPGYISEIEHNKKTPGGDILLSLKRVFEVSVDWILTGNGPKKANQDGPPTDNVIEIEHIDLVKTFKNKPLAKELNQILKKIEDIDEDHLREIKGLLRSELSQLQSKHDDRRKSDRRNEDAGFKGEEQRSGKDRRTRRAAG